MLMAYFCLCTQGLLLEELPGTICSEWNCPRASTLTNPCAISLVPCFAYFWKQLRDQSANMHVQVRALFWILHCWLLIFSYRAERAESALVSFQKGAILIHDWDTSQGPPYNTFSWRSSFYKFGNLQTFSPLQWCNFSIMAISLIYFLVCLSSGIQETCGSLPAILSLAYDNSVQSPWDMMLFGLEFTKGILAGLKDLKNCD